MPQPQASSLKSQGSRKPVIGLAGGIGSGKSAVAKILADLGCVIADSDESAKQALREDTVRSKLVEWWGPAILDGSGQVNRSAVAKIVFGDPVQRKRLESLTHPLIKARRQAIFAAAPAGAPALVIDAPLLFEAGLDRECDAIIFVDAPTKMRRSRLSQQRNWDDAELAAREESQMPLDAKRSRADYVVSNAGDLRALTQQVHDAFKRIIQSRRS